MTFLKKQSVASAMSSGKLKKKTGSKSKFKYPLHGQLIPSLPVK